MKTLKSTILFIMALAFLAACVEEPETDDLLDNTGSGSGAGYWVRHDGAGFIHLSGSTSEFCLASSGDSWTGSYDASSGTIDINLAGTQAHFEVVIDGSTMILVQNFSGGHATETKYYESSSAEYPCGSGGSGGYDDDDDYNNDGGNTDYGSELGDITFWASEDFGCGNTTVYLEGVGSRTIGGYYEYSTPDCGSDYCANFSDLEPGTYSFTASCGDYSWDGTVTVSANECYRMQLTD